jgi:hypothetical protein
VNAVRSEIAFGNGVVSDQLSQSFDHVCSLEPQAQAGAQTGRRVVV